jgi:hypothetical protein
MKEKENFKGTSMIKVVEIRQGRRSYLSMGHTSSTHRNVVIKSYSTPVKSMGPFTLAYSPPKFFSSFLSVSGIFCLVAWKQKLFFVLH